MQFDEFGHMHTTVKRSSQSRKKTCLSPLKVSLWLFVFVVIAAVVVVRKITMRFTLNKFFCAQAYVVYYGHYVV